MISDTELEAFVVGWPSDDDVSFIRDGRKLDTAQKVRDFLAELEATPLPGD